MMKFTLFLFSGLLAGSMALAQSSSDETTKPVKSTPNLPPSTHPGKYQPLKGKKKAVNPKGLPPTPPKPPEPKVPEAK